MNFKDCVICKETKDKKCFVPLQHEAHAFCSVCLIDYINHVNLGIDINNADIEEWTLTALDEKNNDGTIRFKHPCTNLQFSEQDLKTIFNHYTYVQEEMQNKVQQNYIEQLFKESFEQAWLY